VEGFSVSDVANRVCHVRGNPREIGFALGQAVGDRLAFNIDRYIQTGPAKHGTFDAERLRGGALDWLRGLPRRYQDEFEGLAAGSGVPLERLAEWCFVEECVQTGCSALVCTINGRAWVARNNDLWAPDMWGYMTVREVDGRLSTGIFGLEGEMFAGTGINGERLWLHYNWLPACDTPSSQKPHWACFVWLREALETCCTIREVEALLRHAHRDGGMMLFAVDGKTDEYAVFECTCAEHIKRERRGNWIVGTNHSCGTDDENPADCLTGSQLRFRRMEELAYELCGRSQVKDAPRDLRRILADPGVEVRDESHGTVYANVACPSLREIWYTFGGYPAASAGAWQQLAWPWEC
jgi:hypothetical protein